MAKKLQAPEPRELQRLQRAIPALHAWFRATARDLPWRRTRDPYAIWVSEVMLQQTQVATALPYFTAWMQRFPTVTALAKASLDEVLASWAGLGYYARGRNLHHAARLVVERFAGAIPRERELFAGLPGVGPYTSAAVASIAFDEDVAVLDGNVRRVLARLIVLEEIATKPCATQLLAQLAQELLPAGTAALHNQAMMELGALVCTPRSPNCAACPLARPCRARATGDPEAWPRRTARKALPHRQLLVALVERAPDELLLQRRPPSGMLGGLWELPHVPPAAGLSDAQRLRQVLRRELGLHVEVSCALPAVQHAYSHFTETLTPWLCHLRRMATRAAEAKPTRWVKREELRDCAIARADRKVLEVLARERDRHPGLCQK